MYEYEKTTNEIIELANQKGISKNITMYCDSAEPDRIKDFKKVGFRATAVKKEKITGNTYINNQINWLKERRIYIHPSCTNTIKELGQWKWKFDDRRSIYLDEPVNFFDDAIAALRYGVEPWRKNRRIESMSKSALGL